MREPASCAHERAAMSNMRPLRSHARGRVPWRLHRLRLTLCCSMEVVTTQPSKHKSSLSVMLWMAMAEDKTPEDYPKVVLPLISNPGEVRETALQ